MTTTATAFIMQETINDNVIEVDFMGRKHGKDKHKDNTSYSSQVGISKEVYAFTSEKEIEAMINIFNKHINETEGVKRQIACRNKMLFLIGLNVGLRASDIRLLKWSFFFKETTKKEIVINESIGDMNIKVATLRIKERKWKDSYVLQPKKQRKHGKFVKLYFNQAVKKAITSYLDDYPIEDLDNYLFKSRKGNEAISENALWRIIKETAIEAGIDKNIGSHSLRKSFGYHAFHNAEDKNKALVTLQLLFNHSDSRTTLRYIGLLNSEIEEMFYSIDLGLDYL